MEHLSRFLFLCWSWCLHSVAKHPLLPEREFVWLVKWKRLDNRPLFLLYDVSNIVVICCALLEFWRARFSRLSLEERIGSMLLSFRFFLLVYLFQVLQLPAQLFSVDLGLTGNVRAGKFGIKCSLDFAVLDGNL